MYKTLLELQLILHVNLSGLKNKIINLYMYVKKLFIADHYFTEILLHSILSKNTLLF